MTRLPRGYLYILLGEDGRIYIGITSRLRRRLKMHNSNENEGYTQGQRRRLLGVRMYLDRDSAALMEKRLKRWYRGRGNYQAHNQGIDGRRTVIIPRPRDAYGDRIPVGRGNAKQFCREMGLGQVVYADRGRRNLTDVLCAK